MRRPADPWVAVLIVDGWRSQAGLPGYGALGWGHATLMYGPAEPFVLDVLYRISPLSNVTPQLLALTGAIGSIILSVIIDLRLKSILFMLAGVPCLWVAIGATLSGAPRTRRGGQAKDRLA